MKVLIHSYTYCENPKLRYIVPESIFSLVASSLERQWLAAICSDLLRINAEEAAALKDMLAYAAPSSPRTVVQTLKLGHAKV